MIRILKKYLYHLPKALFWNVFYGFPHRKLILIGVTGTDGKTTTCTLIQRILQNSGHTVGIISTVDTPGLHTTSPDPKILQKLFSDFVKQGCTHVVCEVTSHSLDQYRYWGCHFKVSVLTNISLEHLDYHKTMENYMNAKSLLFSQSDIAILNNNCDYYNDFFKKVHTKIITYGTKIKSDIKASHIKITDKLLSFTVDKKTFITDSNYNYQLFNILAALGVCRQLNIDDKFVINTIKKFPHTVGRRQEIDNPYSFKTLIDFAHTPNALLQTLLSLKLNTKGKLICIFGATGGRDQIKRPIMGKVVSENCDIAIVTADDTRNENIIDINKQIISGFNQKLIDNKTFTYYDIPNRQDAFNLAIKLAKSGDTIVACGKGHETSILHGNTEYPWSESDAFKTAFRIREQNV
jgi:UDP-N-acetylmuramoyl-L-alanyl-D-glutamate--2,6-diaminopimelate ligase